MDLGKVLWNGRYYIGRLYKDKSDMWNLVIFNVKHNQGGLLVFAWMHKNASIAKSIVCLDSFSLVQGINKIIKSKILKHIVILGHNVVYSSVGAASQWSN